MNRCFNEKNLKEDQCVEIALNRVKEVFDESINNISL